MSEPKRIFRKNEQTPEQRAIERAERERFSRERPGSEELVSSGEFKGPFPHGEIISEDELNRSIAIIDELLDRVGSLDQGERFYLDALSDLVEKYEDEHHPIP